LSQNNGGVQPGSEDRSNIAIDSQLKRTVRIAWSGVILKGGREGERAISKVGDTLWGAQVRGECDVDLRGAEKELCYPTTHLHFS